MKRNSGMVSGCTGSVPIEQLADLVPYCFWVSEMRELRHHWAPWPSSTHQYRPRNAPAWRLAGANDLALRRLTLLPTLPVIVPSGFGGAPSSLKGGVQTSGQPEQARSSPTDPPCRSGWAHPGLHSTINLDQDRRLWCCCPLAKPLHLAWQPDRSGLVWHEVPPDAVGTWRACP
jgi:hypothetical protein